MRSAQSLNPGTGVETLIKTQNAADAGASHDRNVYGVAGREPLHGRENLPGRVNFRHSKGQCFVGYRVEAGKGGVDGVQSSNSRVSMQDLLIGLDIGNGRC